MSADDTKRRIVVTGIGLISPIGIGRDEFLTNLRAGKSGIAPTTRGECSAVPGEIGGEINAFNDEYIKELFPKKQRKNAKVMCREVQMGAAVTLLGYADAKLEEANVDPQRIGVEFGANLMFFDPLNLKDPCAASSTSEGDFVPNEWGEKGMPAMEPLWMLKYLPNMPACHIGIFTDSRGPNNSVTMDEASFGAAMTEALNVLERNAADVMIVGGTGTQIHPVKAIHAKFADTLGFDAENPSASCKPFDAQRNGQVLSEGAGCLILEAEEHAVARGAEIYAEVLGGASSCAATPDGSPDVPQAIRNVIRASLRRAGLQAADIGHVNAHGLATVAADAMEAAAITAELGNIPVTGLKGTIGNSGAASGFVEAAASILMLREGQIPATANTTAPDASLNLDVVTEPRGTDNKVFLKLNFTPAGQASAVILRVR